MFTHPSRLHLNWRKFGRTRRWRHICVRLRRRPRVLCGDLNTPRRELEDGTLLTFAHDSKGRLRPERGERWDRAERALVRDLGWTDAFRAINGYGTRDASWTFAGDKGGWRLDHVLVCELQVVAASYAHEWRRSGLSDHSALIVDVARDGGGRSRDARRVTFSESSRTRSCASPRRFDDPHSLDARRSRRRASRRQRPRRSRHPAARR